LTKPIKEEVLLQAIRAHSLAADPSLQRESNQMDAIRIRANPTLADLIPEFLENRRNDVTAIRDALLEGDFEIIERLGHGMRGAGGSWGFQGITDIGAALEEAAKYSDAGTSLKWVGELSSYLDRLVVVYD
jgi:HPt (histidine-containing phosphotransfer) domain-containing protein